MKFLLLTEKGSQIEIDTEHVEALTVSFGEKKFEISIKEIKK